MFFGGPGLRLVSGVVAPGVVPQAQKRSKAVGLGLRVGFEAGEFAVGSVLVFGSAQGWIKVGLCRKGLGGFGVGVGTRCGVGLGLV